MADDSTLGLGLNNPQYQDLITKQQEAIKAANQPYGMDAGQGAIAAGLGLLPALIGGLIRGKEGINIGAQAGMAGVGSYDNILKNNYEKRAENEKANAALYGQQASQLAQQELGLQRALQMEQIKQDNRKDLLGLRADLFPPKSRGGANGDNKESGLVDAALAERLSKTIGVPAEQLIGKDKDYVNALQRNVDQESSAKGRELQETEVNRRQRQLDLKLAGFTIPGWEHDPAKKMPTEKDYEEAKARNTGTNLITMTLGEIKKSMIAGGENPWSGIDANAQELYLQRLAEAFRVLNKAGASLTESEQELGKVVRNAQNVGFLEAMKRSQLFSKNPIDSIDIMIPQLKRERFIVMRDRGYNPPVVQSGVTVNSSIFNKLKGK